MTFRFKMVFQTIKSHGYRVPLLSSFGLDDLGEDGGDPVFAVAQQALGPGPPVRRQAALGLGRLNSDAVYEVLDATRFDTDFSVRQAVLVGLARLKDRRQLSAGLRRLHP